MRLERVAPVLEACGAALVVGILVAQLFGAGADNAFVTSYDFREYLAGQKTFFAQAVRAGHLPLWDPHVFSGWPFLANPEAQVFYPASLLYLALPLRHAALADLGAHLLLAWLGAAFLARCAFGLARGPAFFAGLAFAGSGFFVSHGYAGHLTLLQAMAYVPWILAAGIRICATAAGRDDVAGLYRGLLGGGVLLGLQLLTGGAQVAWLGGVTLVLAAVTMLVLARAGLRAWGLAAAGLAGMVVLGAGLAAVQLLPSAELARLSNRPDHDYGYASATSLEPSALETAIAPRVLLDAWSGTPWHEFYAYMGLVPLGLALVGLAAAGRDRRLLLLVPAGMFMAAYMLGPAAGLHRVLFEWVPTFDLFRAPARAIGIVQLVVALLAGAGLQWLGARAHRQEWLAPAALVVAATLTLADVAGTARWHQLALRGPGNNAASALEARQLAYRNAGTLVADASWYRYWASPALLPNNFARDIDRRSVGGYTGIILARYQRFVAALSGYGLQDLGVALLNPQIQAQAPPFPLKLLGVKYELSRGQIHERPGGPDVPRAWFVGAIRRVPDETAALHIMRSATFRPLQEVVIEADAAAAGFVAARAPAGAVSVTVEEPRPEQLLLEVGAHPAGMLVLSEIFYPGWRATDEHGAILPVLRCDSILRCVPLEARATAQRITMELAPPSLRAGAALSGVSVLVCALAGLRLVRKRRVPPLGGRSGLPPRAVRPEA